MTGKKHLFLLFICFVLGATFVYMLWADKVNKTVPPTDLSISVKAHNKLPSEENTEMDLAFSEKMANNTNGFDNVSKRYSEADAMILKDWHQQDSALVAQEYRQSYTEEQLILMANAGDVSAINALVGLYYTDIKHKDKIWPWIEKGIVHGSYMSIMEAVNVYLPMSKSYGGTKEKVKENLIESFAYMELLDMRNVGKLYPIDMLKRSAISKFEKKFNVDNPLTETDLQKIQNRAEELYSHYESERRKLGLGNFNNELPEVVRDFVSR